MLSAFLHEWHGMHYNMSCELFTDLSQLVSTILPINFFNNYSFTDCALLTKKFSQERGWRSNCEYIFLKRKRAFTFIVTFFATFHFLWSQSNKNRYRKSFLTYKHKNWIYIFNIRNNVMFNSPTFKIVFINMQCLFCLKG